MPKKTAIIEPSAKSPIPVHVTTDSNIDGDEELIQRVEKETRHILGRFANQIVSVDVHFTDEDGAKNGTAGKRCLMEVRCSGLPPVAASDESATVEGSFQGAAKKLQHVLESGLSRAEADKGGETIRHENSAEREEISADRL